MKDSAKASIATAAGAGVGVATYGTIGGIGIAATGTAVGITLGPFIAIGAVLGLTVYGLYWGGKQRGKQEKE